MLDNPFFLKLINISNYQNTSYLFVHRRFSSLVPKKYNPTVF